MKAIIMKSKDEILIKRAISGDKDAFGLLVEKYKGMVCGLAYHKVGNFQDAEDLAQEAFIQAYQSLHRLKEHDKFPYWLYSITSNVCVSWLRRKRLDTVPLESAPGGRNIVDWAPTPAEVVESKELQNTVLNAIAKLPEPNRLAVTLYYMDGLSVQEISDFLNVPAGTVKSRLHNARKQLKGELMSMVEQTFVEHKPGKEFTPQLQARIDSVLAESTEILTGLLKQEIPDADGIKRIKTMVERFSTIPTTEVDSEQLWKDAFGNVIGQHRETAFKQALQLLYSATDLDLVKGQIFSLATLDVLKMAEEDIERKPNDINILMGYMIGQHTSGGRFEFRSSDWYCVSWGDLGVFEEIYRASSKIPLKHLEVGMNWKKEVAGKWEISIYDTTIEADNDVVLVPAGEFHNCIKVTTVASSRHLGKESKHSSQTLWMAPGVGIVKFSVKVLDRENRDKDIELKEFFIPQPSQDYMPLVIGSRWRYEWSDQGFNAPTAEVYRLICQKGEDFYFSRARYIYGNYADSEVGKIVAAEKMK
jgi:RNA polymerase sigma-70 factor (ECF subfamily)